MSDLFGGKSETKLNVYGEVPGWEKTATDTGSALSNWLKGLQTGGTTAPGLSETSQLWDQVQGGTGLGMKGLSDWLGEYKEAPGLQNIMNADRAQTERDIELARKNTLMQFGGRGQSFSSPMARSMMDAETQARTALQGRTGGYQYGDYSNWRSMQPQLISLALQQPAMAAQLLGSQGQAFIQALLQYLSAGKGQPFTTTEESQGLLGALGGGAGVAALL